MLRHTRIAMGVILFAWVAALPSHAEDPWQEVLHGALAASGIEDASAVEPYAGRFRALVAAVDSRIGRARSAERRARKIHEAIHDIKLRLYRPEADGLADLLDRGEFNCVSATLLEGLLYRALGYRSEVVAGPGHVFLRVEIDGRAVDVESTSPYGFDVRKNPARIARFLLAYRLATREDLARRGVDAVYDAYQGLEAPVPLEEALGFLWHNVGERLLAEGESVRSAEAFLEAHRRHPRLAARSETLQTALGRAFRAEYESGRFDEAFRIATVEFAIFPERTGAKERLLAAAAQRIDTTADAGEPDAAEGILDEVATLAPGLSHRLERLACPPIALSAAREGDWDRAQRMAVRFAAAEPDPVSGSRLAVWIENRRREATTTHPTR